MTTSIPSTKIVCTIGPASGSADMIRQLIDNGMRVARLNFSHGTHADHAEKIGIIREVSAAANKPVAILQDLAGPKIRTGAIAEPGIRLEPGHRITLTTDPDAANDTANQERITVSYSRLTEDVRPGDRILLADGLMELSVASVSETDIACDVITGGVLTSHKGINLPSSSIGISSITDKDKTDLAFGLDQGVDFVALSFVRSAVDVETVKDIIQQAGRQTPVIAKIEKHEAIQNLDGILEEADGIMIARGDLGVEIPLEDVPVIQKRLIRQANQVNKPVITATQMLRSMVDSPRPTRAEASDVANAVMDGTDAVMLSEETASGNYPVQAVRYMARIVENAEKACPADHYKTLIPAKEISDSVTYSACVLADHLDAAAILAPTRSGRTAIALSRLRPRQPVFAFTPDESVLRRLSLYRGVYPRLNENFRDTDIMIENATTILKKANNLSKDDITVITSGHPLWVPGTTNMIRVKTIE
ncbi:MAG: pyruvate kinase [Thermodesulfobacteriota bacterium]|nr:pyruvate kinase [Thermodesulfobacteriota bacterium]